MKKLKIKKFWKLLTFVSILFIPVLTPASVFSQPGSAQDPLISRSYLEQRLAGLSLTGITEDLIEFIIQDIVSILGGSTPVIAPQPSTFTPVRAVGGQRIIGGEGTEIILRGGQATAFTSGPDGLVNVTFGTELFGGESIPANHLLIVPRADGRGVNVHSAEAWFIIRGEYTIQ